MNLTVICYARTMPEAQEIDQTILKEAQTIDEIYLEENGLRRGLFCVTKKIDITEETKDAKSQELATALTNEPRVTHYEIFLNQ